MSSNNTNTFTKENLDTYLKELGKEFRRINGKGMPAEIILIGGAAIIANYGFRDMTTDIDAVIHAVSSMKDAINHIGDKYNLPNGWLNTDFTKTASYTPKLDEFSVYYKEFSNVLRVRTISAEYLIAMKLCSGRKYKKDLSDIVGILVEHQNRGTPITIELISKAVTDLYGGWSKIPDDSQIFIKDIMRSGNLQDVYQSIRASEDASKELLKNFNQNYSGIAKTDTVANILKNLKAKTKNKEHELQK